MCIYLCFGVVLRKWYLLNALSVFSGTIKFSSFNFCRHLPHLVLNEFYVCNYHPFQKERIENLREDSVCTIFSAGFDLLLYQLPPMSPLLKSEPHTQRSVVLTSSVGQILSIMSVQTQKQLLVHVISTSGCIYPEFSL